MISNHEGAERTGLLLDELKRIVVAHSDSLSKGDRQILLMTAVGELFCGISIDAMESRLGHVPSLAEAVAEMRAFPWEALIKPVLLAYKLAQQAKGRT